VGGDPVKVRRVYKQARNISWRLLHSDATERQLAERFGVSVDLIRKVYVRHSTPSQRIAAQRRKWNTVRAAIGKISVRSFYHRTSKGKMRRFKKRFIKIGKDHWIAYAIFVWEAANGRVPPGYCVVHKNNDLLDDSYENLACIPRDQVIRHILRTIPGAEQKRVEEMTKSRRIHEQIRRQVREGKEKIQELKHGRKAEQAGGTTRILQEIHAQASAEIY
jgi:hypothetical protein